MPSVVYTHPLGLPERVFLCGLGAFEHGVPRDCDAGVVASLLGTVRDGVFERNACFSLAAAPVAAPAAAVVAAPVAASAAPVAADIAAPDTLSDPVLGSADDTTQRRRRKKE